MKKMFLFVILFLLLTGCSYKVVKEESIQNFQAQATCAEQAQIFFNDKDKSGDFQYSFENYFNSKLNKCFVLIRAISLEDDNLYIDLYDALERKHYAMYLGHNDCDVVTLLLIDEPKKCQLDSGTIWLDGNDAKESADFTFGFVGLNNGVGVGDENTQKQFMEQVQSFMTE